jgi:Ca2+-binding EF-hand superfamily protein
VIVLNFIASQLPQKDIMSLGRVFMEIDKNKDGNLTVEELSRFMKQQDSNPNLKDMAEVIEHMDVDHNGQLAYN